MEEEKAMTIFSDFLIETGISSALNGCDIDNKSCARHESEYFIMKRFALIVAVVSISMNAFAQYGGYNGGYLGTRFNTDAVFNAIMQQTFVQCQEQQARLNETFNQLMQQAADAVVLPNQNICIYQDNTYQGSTSTAGCTSSSLSSSYSVDSDNASWDTYYRNAYSGWESRVQSTYNSIIDCQRKDSNSGATSYDKYGSYTSSMISTFHQQQNEMKKVRQEAQTKGIRISPSCWETASISVY